MVLIAVVRPVTSAKPRSLWLDVAPHTILEAAVYLHTGAGTEPGCQQGLGRHGNSAADCDPA